MATAPNGTVRGSIMRYDLAGHSRESIGGSAVAVPAITPNSGYVRSSEWLGPRNPARVELDGRSSTAVTEPNRFRQRLGQDDGCHVGPCYPERSRQSAGSVSPM